VAEDASPAAGSHRLAFTWMALMALAIGLVVYRVMTREAPAVDTNELVGSAVGLGPSKPAGAGEGIDPTPYQSLITLVEEQVYADEPDWDELRGHVTDLTAELAQHGGLAAMKTSRQMLHLLEIREPAPLVAAWEQIRSEFRPAPWFHHAGGAEGR